MSLKIENYSFGIGLENDFGLKLILEFDEDTKTAYSKEVIIPTHFQGNTPNKVHPGILASILDEVMMYINNSLNLDVSSNELIVRYLQEAHTESSLHVRGYFVKKNKSIIENRAEIEDHLGKIVARAKGKYNEIDALDTLQEDED